MVLLCGRFEGLDECVLEYKKIEEVSIGDFVLVGGEVVVMVLIEVVVWVLFGVVGDVVFVGEESFEMGLFEYL